MASTAEELSMWIYFEAYFSEEEISPVGYGGGEKRICKGVTDVSESRVSGELKSIWTFMFANFDHDFSDAQNSEDGDEQNKAIEDGAGNWFRGRENVGIGRKVKNECDRRKDGDIS